MSETRVFGIRHHGPGSARSLLAALGEFRPDAVLIEGPPEAAAVLPLAVHPEMEPPVAILVYVPEDPQRAAFYPFTEFSPEWAAIGFALRAGIEARFIDLPAAHLLTDKRHDEPDPEEFREDPLGLIAEAAGYSDGERWWEHMVEQRQDAVGMFEAIQHLMTELRQEVGARPKERENQREAHMRLAMRQAAADGFQRIAVVCGAWHVPALLAKETAAADQALLKGLLKVKVAATWVPWTYDRIGYHSGYGAGVASPGYYEHLWRSPPERVVSGWILKVARLLREEQLDASPASVIEAVRLAEALAAVRDRPVAGLAELNDASLSVLCGGSTLPMEVIARKLIVGEVLGHIPEETPMVPLQADLTALQRRLRMKPDPSQKRLELDLRNETDLDRSRLLHRLSLLNVDWAFLQPVSGKSGTFHEHWLIEWRPELSVRVIEAALWGSTVLEAATACLVDSAMKTPSLSDLARLANEMLLADLAVATPPVMERLEAVAAASSDVFELLRALPRLGAIIRYGDVRKTDTSLVEHVFDSIFARACVGLPSACASLDDEAATHLSKLLVEVQGVVSLLEEPDRVVLWQEALFQAEDVRGVNGLVGGKVCRLLMEQRALTAEQASVRLGLATSTVAEPAEAAAWIEGFLSGSGTILLHEATLLSTVDDWIANLRADAFTEILPLLRRTFATFSHAERRQIGERVVSGVAVVRRVETGLDLERAARPVPILQTILDLEVVE